MLKVSFSFSSNHFSYHLIFTSNIYSYSTFKYLLYPKLPLPNLSLSIQEFSTQCFFITTITITTSSSSSSSPSFLLPFTIITITTYLSFIHSLPLTHHNQLHGTIFIQFITTNINNSILEFFV